MPRTKLRRHTKQERTPPNRRSLLEQCAVGIPGVPPLRVDEQAGVIFRVKVLGRFSRNHHGLREAENGTEYSAGCMRAALALYEGAKVKANHPADRSAPGKERPVDDTFGVLRNCVVESDERGEPAVWADLHYLTSHPLAPRVVEDVRRGLGVYGLSHNAAAARERFDRAARRLVIEELATVRSVDLVDKPATNRNLWESERPMPTNVRTLLESRRESLTKKRAGWLDRLLEMYEGDDPGMSAEVPAEAGGGDPDSALLDGFRQAVMAIFDGEGSAAEKAKKIANYLKTHEKLTGSAEPEEAPEVEESEDDDDEEGGKGKDVAESEELKTLRAEKKARDLCESLGLVPTSLQVAAVAGLPADKQRRELVESFKGQSARGGFRQPKVAAPGAGGAKKPAAGSTNRDVQESTAADDLAALRNC